MSDIMNLRLNDWVTCPFDPVHRLKYSKFHNHFVKCRKNHPDDPRQPCPYNATELIEPDKMNDHKENCKYKIIFAKNNDNAYNIPDYVAPTHIDLFDPNKPVNPRTHFEDSDEEIDSISVVGPNFNEPTDVDDFLDCDGHRVRISREKIELPTERRGFGRGQMIRETLKRDDLTSSSSFSVARPSIGRGALYAKFRN